MTAKVIVITGASSGIGAALALQLAQRGDKVVLAARRQAELEQVASRCGAQARPVVTDVTRRADVERLREQALDAFGAVDVWVNNAGQGIGRPVLDLTDEDFDLMMAVNAKSALYGMQAIVPYFKSARRGPFDQCFFGAQPDSVRQLSLGLQRRQSCPQQPDHQPAHGPAPGIPWHTRFSGHAPNGQL